MALRMRDLDGSGQHVRELLHRFRRIKEDCFPEHRNHPLFLEMAAVNLDDVARFYESFARRVRVATFPEVAKDSDTVVFEGAQGVLLDEEHGYHPHVTWTDCTFGNADKLLADFHSSEVTRIGVLRSYATRHGAGPFPTEDASLALPDPHNSAHPYMGHFRVGHFDAVLSRYAAQRSRWTGETGRLLPDYLAVTHLDRHSSARICTRYRMPDDSVQGVGTIKPDAFRGAPEYEHVNDLVGGIEYWTGVSVGVTSHGPTALDKKWSSRPTTV